MGTWLPEPILTDPEADVAQQVETADSLSLAFLVLLESLTPVERAVFLLREVFDYAYDEIAEIVGKSEDNCRQIAVRARKQVDAKRPRFEASRARRDELSRRFFEAVREGDTEGLIELLAADVVVYADGGGEGPAFPRPVHGRDRAARVLMGATRGGERLGITGTRFVLVNGQPGALFLGPDAQPLVVVSVDIVDDSIQAVARDQQPGEAPPPPLLGRFGDLVLRRVLGFRSPLVAIGPVLLREGQRVDLLPSRILLRRTVFTRDA